MSNSEHDATGKMPESVGEVELRDAEIAEISGGATGGLYPEKIHWEDLVEWRVRCSNCGSSYVKRNSGYEYMVSGFRATCDYCGSSSVETHFMRMIQEGYYPSSQFR